MAELGFAARSAVNLPAEAMVPSMVDLPVDLPVGFPADSPRADA
jgi:hypothetical protein